MRAVEIGTWLPAGCLLWAAAQFAREPCQRRGTTVFEAEEGGAATGQENEGASKEMAGSSRVLTT